MKISSITSLFKSKKFLVNFVDQFYRQSFFKETEIIIIDCNSDDEDYNIIKNFCAEPNVIYQKEYKDPGMYGAWNMAIKKATTPYITNSNTDDVKAPWYFETMYEYMEHHPECDVAYGPVGKSSKVAAPFYEDFPKELWQCLETNLSTMLVENSPHCMPTWRTKLHDEIGKFDGKYDIKADFEFWLRCVKNKKRFDKLNITMGNYYFNFSGVSMKDSKERDQQHVDIVKKYYKDEPASIFNLYNQVAGVPHPLAAAQSLKTFSKMIINRG